MNTLEQAPRYEEMPDFGMEAFGMSEDFDINAAFQEALQGVASDAELALEDKVRRMEFILSEGTSDVYRDFVDFRRMAAQMRLLCNDDHALNQSMQGNEALSSFLNKHKDDDGHNHGNSLLGKHNKHNSDEDDEEESTESKNGKKSKRKRPAGVGWFGVYV